MSGKPTMSPDDTSRTERASPSACEERKHIAMDRSPVMAVVYHRFSELGPSAPEGDAEMSLAPRRPIVRRIRS